MLAPSVFVSLLFIWFRFFTGVEMTFSTKQTSFALDWSVLVLSTEFSKKCKIQFSIQKLLNITKTLMLATFNHMKIYR